MKREPAPQPHPDWLAQLRAHVDRPPAVARLPLWWQGTRIGSVEPGFMEEIGRKAAPVLRGQLQKEERLGEAGWSLRADDLSAALHEVALTMREHGLAHAWRDEQLAVRDAQGRLLGTVERGCVRPLGIATHAVHLVGYAPDGRHWVQQRSLDKPNDPGLWDTLVGGMVPARDSVEEALARETGEEAGLELAQVSGLAYGGYVTLRGPSTAAHGYVEERIDWWRCTLPEGVVPENRDGEVMQFARMAGDEVCARMERGEFTAEAAMILLAAGL
jgi:8-oxo-dGTP pyrophosphatase MutT (NUDIX family)